MKRLRRPSSWFSKKSASRAARRRQFKSNLQMEQLEDRRVLATFTVNVAGDTPDETPGDGTAADSSGNTSLRAAIEEANAFAGADVIEFNLPAGDDAINLTIGELPITEGLTITGPGARNLTIEQTGTGRVFHIPTPDAVTISGVTIAGGSTSSGNGGGILRNGGDLTLTNVTVSGNSAARGGGVYVVAASSTFTMTGSTIANNNAAVQGGGLFIGDTTANISNSTISGNMAGSFGGGIGLSPSSTASVASTTITQNRGNTGGAVGLGVGGGISAAGSDTTLHNTIVAENFYGAAGSTPDDIQATVDGTSSFNLIGGGGSGGLFNGTNGNQVGVTNPMLGPLADNGGPTDTHAPLTPDVSHQLCW